MSLLIYRVLSLSLMARLKEVEQRKWKVGGMVDDITEEANPGGGGVRHGQTCSGTSSAGCSMIPTKKYLT